MNAITGPSIRSVPVAALVLLLFGILLAAYFVTGSDGFSFSQDPSLGIADEGQSPTPPELTCAPGEKIQAVHSDAAEGSDLMPSHRAAFEGELRQDYPALLPGAFRLAYESESMARYELASGDKVIAYSQVDFHSYPTKSGWSHSNSMLCASLTGGPGPRP